MNEPVSAYAEPGTPPPEIDDNPLDTGRAEIPWQAADALESWDRILANLEDRKALAFQFTRGATEILRLAEPLSTPEAWQQIVDDLHSMGRRHGLSDATVQGLMAAATAAPPDQSTADIVAFGNRDDRPEPPAAGPEAFGLSIDGERVFDAGAPAVKVEIATLPPLTVVEWRERDLPSLVLLMGEWLSTTSRVLITAATGLGKTNYGLALAMRAAAGLDFLHWKAQRTARALYIDGEMSRRLLRQRVLSEAQRIGADPEGFFVLSHQDVPGGMKALNTPEGQAWVNAFIEKIGGVDLVIFDNTMSLTTGDQKESEPWRQTLPWSLSLTKRDIGQVWIHHTGHDESRSYGDKTREWQMDAVAHFDRVERDDTDISFSMKFTKARERTPENRFDFQDVKIALVNDQWEHELSRAQRPDKISPQAARALDALRNVIAGDQATPLPGGRRAAATADWKAECVLLGLIDAEAKPHSARTLFAKYRRELVGAFRIGCEGDFSWLT